MVELDTNQDTFHVLTVIEGVAEFIGPDTQFSLNQYESVLVPANYQTYQLAGKFKILKGSLNGK